MKDIVIIGCGGLGREVAWLIRRINEKNSTWNILGFIDDNPNNLEKEFSGYKVIGTTDYLQNYCRETAVVCAIANTNIRKKIITKIKQNKLLNFPVLIDPDAIISDESRIGEGSIVCARSLISVNVNLGKYSIVDWTSTIGHDTCIGDFCTLYPSVNVSGYVKLGSLSEVGTGTQIIQGISIGDNVTLGAGSVIVRDVQSSVTVVGVPGRIIKNKEGIV